MPRRALYFGTAAVLSSLASSGCYCYRPLLARCGGPPAPLHTPAPGPLFPRLNAALTGPGPVLAAGPAVGGVGPVAPPFGVGGPDCAGCGSGAGPILSGPPPVLSGPPPAGAYPLHGAMLPSGYALPPGAVMSPPAAALPGPPSMPLGQPRVQPEAAPMPGGTGPMKN